MPVGRLLMRGSEPCGVLGTMKDEGIKAGTDLQFNNNRFSGLWGPQTPLGLWLQENEVSTLFGGVAAVGTSHLRGPSLPSLGLGYLDTKPPKGSAHATPSKMLFATISTLLVLFQAALQGVYAKCCHESHEGTCGDGSRATPCCGYKACNGFCCACPGGRYTIPGIQLGPL